MLLFPQMKRNEGPLFALIAIAMAAASLVPAHAEAMSFWAT
jgi:hypothetical protein